VTTRDTTRPERLLTFRSGGWVLALAGIGVAILLLQVVLHLSGLRAARIGDGESLASYRFPLEPCLIPRDRIDIGMEYRDKLMAMVDPETWTVKEHEEKRSRRGKTFLVSGQRVIGVDLGDEARAYPLTILNWHEVVNDTLGGRKIAVTYHPLCDSVAVFDRKVGDEVLEFGVSGLLHESNHLLYERREEVGTESLWSQLRARAVTGPMAEAGAELTTVPFEVLTWADWRERHPETTMVAPNPRLSRDYKRRPYASYYGRQIPRFPVEPYPPPVAGETEAWSRIEVRADGSLARLPERDGEPGTTPPDDGLATHFHAFWWAWHAAHPDQDAVPR